MNGWACKRIQDIIFEKVIPNFHSLLSFRARPTLSGGVNRGRSSSVEYSLLPSHIYGKHKRSSSVYYSRPNRLRRHHYLSNAGSGWEIYRNTLPGLEMTQCFQEAGMLFLLVKGFLLLFLSFLFLLKI
ncbi:hypothetical protein CEXT_561131 [Caerostris extrusa]|uniref:Uncharacterized protein n=1 Tax=Caerostris extrusa TaxID=172846 RepID=A0AAV4T4X5_CAEEX|nr:hypothetical protein CEXT_561131 [Caerostris extrusa]